MKLPGSTKIKTDKDENVKKVPFLEINEVVLIHCNTVNNYYQHDSRMIHLFLINHLVHYSIFHQNILYFEKLLTQNFPILKYGLLIKILCH